MAELLSQVSIEEGLLLNTTLEFCVSTLPSLAFSALGILNTPKRRRMVAPGRQIVLTFLELILKALAPI